MALILENYLDININRAVELYYDKIYSDDFDPIVVGAIILGEDIKQLFKANYSALQHYIEVLQNELADSYGSLLINQMLNSHKMLKYNQVYNALAMILKEIYS